MKKTIKVMVDNRGQKVKNTENLGTQQLALRVKEFNNVKEFSDYIYNGIDGHSFSTMVSEAGKRKNEDFEESSFVALDIDESDNLKIKDFMKISEDIDLKANILYETYSSVDGNRYRVIYRIETTTSQEIARLHNLLLFEIFSNYDDTKTANKGIDRGSLQQSKLYQPTNKQIIYNHENILYLEDLLMKALSYSNNRKALLQKIMNNTHIDISNNWIKLLTRNDVLDFKYDKDCKYLKFIENYKISKFNTANIGILKDKNIVKLDKTIMNFTSSASVDILKNRCVKINEMINGTYGKPDYPDFLNTAINMCYIKGGQTAMSEIIELNYDNQTSISDKQKNLQEIADRVKNGTLHNSCCSADNCQFYSTCKNKKPCSILSVAIQKQGQITKKERKEISLDEGRKKLMENIIKAIEEHDTNNIILLKSDCGLGKTYTIIDLFNKYDNIGLFLPTHLKCKEVYDILREKMDICYVKPFPSIDLVPNNYMSDYLKIKTYNELGFSSEVVEELKLMQRMLMLDLNNKRTMEKLKKEGKDKQLNDFFMAIGGYLVSRIDSKMSTKVIATHQYLTNVGGKAFSKIDKIIIDEDILNSLIDTRSCDMKTLFKIIDELKKQGDMDKYINILNNMLIADSESICVVDNRFKITVSEALKITNVIEKVGIKVDDILFCKSYIRVGDKLMYANIANIDKHPNQSIINLTATPSPQKILTKAFNANIKLYETDSVKLKGQIIQFPNIACYKNNLKDKDYFKKITNILNDIGVENVITYKSFKQDFENEGFDCDIYFGNEEGLNIWSGQDVAVVGTYLQNPTATQIIASLTYDKGNYKLVEKMTRQRVEVDKVEQTLQTFRDDLLKEIQLHALYSKIIQASGRSRAISTNAVVYVFATLCHPQADICNLKIDDDMDNLLDILDDIYKR